MALKHNRKACFAGSNHNNDPSQRSLAPRAPKWECVARTRARQESTCVAKVSYRNNFSHERVSTSVACLPRLILGPFPPQDLPSSRLCCIPSF
jgi:hypothetical protein